MVARGSEGDLMGSAARADPSIWPARTRTPSRSWKIVFFFVCQGKAGLGYWGLELGQEGVPVDSSPESEHVSEEEFEASLEDSLVLFLELELLDERFLLVLFFLGCLFLLL